MFFVKIIYQFTVLYKNEGLFYIILEQKVYFGNKKYTFL